MQHDAKLNIEENNVFFSVLIPSYNRPDLLEQTILSVLGSTYRNYELLISDDNSPLIDDILHVISTINFDIPFKFFGQNVNLGPSENKNFLVNNARGEYVIILGDDDLLDKDILMILNSEIVLSNRGISIYGFGYNIIDEFNCNIGIYKTFKRLLISNENSRINRIFFEGNILPFYFFHPFSLCYRKSIGITYKKEAHIGYDFLFLFESILNNQHIMVLPYVGFSWRKAQKTGPYQNLSNVKSNDLISRMRIYEYFFKNCNSINQLNFILPENHICKFIGNTLLLDRVLLKENLNILKINLDKDDYYKIQVYLNNYFIRFIVLGIKFYQCIQIQGYYSFHYFGLRLKYFFLKKKL